jgi:agmatinase
VCGGLTTYQAQAILYRLVGLHLIGMDLVEVSPPYDHAEVTALAAATIALDWLCLLAATRLGQGPPDPYQGGSGRAPGMRR